MTSLKERILHYLQAYWEMNPDTWLHKGFIESIAKEAGYLGETAGREIRRLIEEGKVEARPKGKSQEIKYIPDITEIANSL